MMIKEIELFKNKPHSCLSLDYEVAPGVGFTFWVATCGATSMIRGLSMILAVQLPFSTIPIIHAWWPSPYLGT